MSTPNPFSQLSFCPTHRIACIRSRCCVFQDHALAGFSAGTVVMLCMNPLDLLKAKFQLSMRGPKGDIARGIQASEGWLGLDDAANASSWWL
jgi:hypothetical protein